MEYDADQDGPGETGCRCSVPVVESPGRSVLLRINSLFPVAKGLGLAMMLLPIQACVFDGLTGSRPQNDAITFSIVGPDTIGIADTLFFTLGDRTGFSGTEPALRVLWLSETFSKATWAARIDTLGEGTFVVIQSLDTALAVGVDTGSTRIIAQLIAPELSDGIADTLDVAVVPKLAFTTQPRDSISTGETQTVTVAILDGRNEIVREPRRITLSLGLLNATDSLVRVVDRANQAATFFFGDSAIDASDGVATFDSVRIFTPGSGYTLVASSGRLTRSSSLPFRVGQLILRVKDGDGQSDTVNTRLAIPPSVELVNELGRPVKERTVRFRVSAGGGTLLSDSMVNTNDSGIASVEWRLGMVADSANNVLEAFVENANEVQPVFVTATALPDRPDELDLITEPSSTASCNLPLITQPIVGLRDRFNNRSGDSLVPVTAELTSGNNSLQGTTNIATDADGRAVFTDLSINGSPGSYNIRFSSAGLSSTVSSAVQLFEGSPTQLNITNQPPASVNAGSNFPNQNDPEISILDACGNPIEDLPVTVSLTPSTGTINGTTTQTTNQNGIATFTNLSITPDDTNPGDYSFQLTFSSQSLPSATSDVIVVTVTQPSGSSQNASTQAVGPVRSVSGAGTGGAS